MSFQLETPTHPSVLQEHPYTRKVVPRLNDTGIASILFMRLHQQHVLEFDRHVDLDKMGPKTRKGYKSTYFGVNSHQLPTFLGYFYPILGFFSPPFITIVGSGPILWTAILKFLKADC